MTKIDTPQEWLDKQYDKYQRYVNEVTSSNKILKAYSKLPEPARNVIRKTKKEAKSMFTDKDTGKIRKGRVATWAAANIVPVPGASMAVLGGYKAYDKWKARKKNESQFFDNDSKYVVEGIIGKIAKRTYKLAKPISKTVVGDMTKDAIKNKISSDIKQKVNNSSAGQNIKNMYQDKKMGIVNKMKEFSNNINKQVNDADPSGQLTQMATGMLGGPIQRKRKQYGDFTPYKKYRNL